MRGCDGSESKEGEGRSESHGEMTAEGREEGEGRAVEVEGRSQRVLEEDLDISRRCGW